MSVTVAAALVSVSTTASVGATLLPYWPPFVMRTDEIEPPEIIGEKAACAIILAPPPVDVIDAVLLYPEPCATIDTLET